MALPSVGIAINAARKRGEPVMPNISPEGAVKVAVTVDDFVLWDGVPMPDGVTPLGITKSIAATLTDHGLTGVYPSRLLRCRLRWWAPGR